MGVISLHGQNKPIGGTVTSEEDNLPLIGVMVVVEGNSKQATITDFDGNYSINAPSNGKLVFSYIGYKTQTVEIKGQSKIDVELKNDALMLDEVVAIGYGSMKKSDLTGAVASIKADQLQKTPASGIDQALQGRAAGVTVNANSGQPGAAAEVRIRGIGTINDSSPIYVVDGLIVGDISFLSPNDIESTEILKDASSTAIYGARGANGVILITTRKGKEGKTKISVNSYIGIQNRWNKLDLMKRDEFASTVVNLANTASEINDYKTKGFNGWLAVYRLGTSPYYPTTVSTTNPNGLDYSKIETDWQDEVFKKNALIQNHHISIEGGNDKNRYAISASYFNQDGTIIGSDYERLTIRANSSVKVKDWLTVGENISFMTSTGRNAMNNNASPGASILSAALAMAPWDPTHYPEGSVSRTGKDLSGQISASSNFRNVVNPFSMVTNSHPENTIERWVGDVFLELTPLEGLKYRSSVSLDLANHRDRLFKNVHEHSTYDKLAKNFLSISTARYSTVLFENILTYGKTIGKHDFSVMGGQTVEEYNLYSMGGSGSSIINPRENNWYLSQVTEDKTFSDDAQRTRMFSLLGRLHYSYNNRYLATLNFRADASSKFPENLWGYFPSVALAWRMSEEDFLKDIPFLDNLKLRGGWGQIGNDKVDLKSFIQTMFNQGPSFVNYPLGSPSELIPGATVLTYVDKNGKWETTEQVNIGIDFGLFNGLLSGTIDGFIRDTKDMILPINTPAYIGNRVLPKSNIGKVRNKGLEISLEHLNKIGQINYTLSANASFINNKLVALNEGDRLHYDDGRIIDEGYALYTFWGYKYEGVYRTQAELDQHLYGYSAGSNPYSVGDAKFADLDSDGKIGDGDKADIGNPFPWLTYGFNIGLDYKGFDIQLFFQGIYGNELYNAVRVRTEGKGLESTLSTTMRDVWTPSTPNGSIPNPYGNPSNSSISSRFIESGSYFRLKNLQLGYTLPKNLILKSGLERVRFYTTMSNLFTLTNYTGYDPEVGGGIDYGNYPQSRTLIFGVNLEF